MTLVVRRDKPLMEFDDTISDTLVECMEMTGLKILNHTNITNIEKSGGKVTLIK